MMSDFHNQSRSDQAPAAMLANFEAQPEDVQIQLVYILGREGEPTHFELLTQLLPTVQGEVRCAIIDVLSHDPERALPLLLNELHHPDPIVRWVASGLLSNLADERTVSALLD